MRLLTESCIQHVSLKYFLVVILIFQPNETKLVYHVSTSGAAGRRLARVEFQTSLVEPSARPQPSSTGFLALSSLARAVLLLLCSSCTTGEVLLHTIWKAGPTSKVKRRKRRGQKRKRRRVEL